MREAQSCGLDYINTSRILLKIELLNIPRSVRIDLNIEFVSNEEQTFIHIHLNVR